MNGSVELRWRRLEEGDLVAVAMLDRTCQGHPWTAGHFRDELSRGDGGFARVLEDPEVGVVGFICAWLVVDELHIGTIGVDPEVRRKGLGRGMMTQAHKWAANRGATAAHLEVRAGNDAAIALYKRIGYRHVGVRRAYYADNGEDAFLLFADLLPEAASDAKDSVPKQTSP
jgi:ribosomal-protein-alanine N-acetyltransferase